MKESWYGIRNCKYCPYTEYFAPRPPGGDLSYLDDRGWRWHFRKKSEGGGVIGWSCPHCYALMEMEF